jgi:2,4-dienoyl-CoA reductase-like NADH-dependent reductase (Old Yellow Enzyme family)
MMEADNKKLFSSIDIKNFTFRNRIGVAPMTRISADEASIPRQDVFDFLIRRAQNGAGLVYTEAIVTDYESAQGYPRQSRITTQNQIDAWKKVATAIRKEGAVSIMQLFHCGRMAWEGINPANRVIAPSPISPQQNNPMTGAPYPVPEEMSVFDINHVINGFVETARGAIAAGFDGIEIHGAHGYLINQFLSTYSNKRTDAYGGSLDNRFRFAREVIQAVKAAIPEDRLLLFRVSNWGIADMSVSLFSGPDEWQDLIRMISAQPIDALSVSTYNFADKAFGTNRNMAQLTREVTDLPLFICGKIHDSKTADQAIQDADIVLSAKSMLLNPNLVEDIQAGKDLPLYTSEEANRAYTGEALP